MYGVFVRQFGTEHHVTLSLGASFVVGRQGHLLLC